MTLADIFKRASKLAADNSPAILSAVAVAGVVTTAYFTGKATVHATRLIENEKKFRAKMDNHEPLTNKEVLSKTWKFYIPAAGTACTTMLCIVLANRIGTRRAAALAGAFAVSEKTLVEYREKVLEKLGEKKEQEIRDEIAQDRVTNNPIGDREVIITGSGRQLCYDAYTGRYFFSDMETIKKAQNDLDYKALHDDHPSLTDFYHMIGLRPTVASDEVGWNVDNRPEIAFSATLAEHEGQMKPCMVVNFQVQPIRNYYKNVY